VFATGVGWIVGWGLVHSDFAGELYVALEGTNVTLSSMVAALIEGGIIGFIVGFFSGLL